MCPNLNIPINIIYQGRASLTGLYGDLAVFGSVGVAIAVIEGRA
jgi:hypothetical protein